MEDLAAVKAALVAGNNYFLQQLFDTHQDFCLAYLQQRMGCRIEDAEDVFMDALLIVRENILSGKATHLDNMRDYLLTICLNQQRARLRHWQTVQAATYPITQALYDTSPATPQDEHYRMQVARSTFTQLSERCQQVLHYYYVDKLSMAEIASRMGWASAQVAKTSKARCYRCWLKLVNEQHLPR